MKKQIILSAKLISIILMISFLANGQKIANPLFNGFYAADPSIVKFEDSYYIYATIDPWGDDELAVFETKNFTTWEQKHINWPTKQACTSSTSKGAKVWAPSVIKAPNGKFYMYVSVGNEVWAGVSKHPLGPWQNIKKDNSPLIRADAIPGYHMIDAECFIDDDGQAYLYWGSGWNWVNGRCFAVKLKSDMFTFDGLPTDIQVPNYFEAPFMYKRNGTYYLMYSEGKAIDATYKIRYSIGATPLGPWTEGVNSPIISTSKDSTIYGPGHHAVFNDHEQSYILYHKIFPQNKDYVLRQLCIDSLNFDMNGNIKPIISQGIIFNK